MTKNLIAHFTSVSKSVYLMVYKNIEKKSKNNNQTQIISDNGKWKDAEKCYTSKCFKERAVFTE